MNQGLIPRRYAKALYKLAAEKSCTGRIYTLMLQLARSFAASADLQKVMANPFVADADKLLLLSTAAGATEADTLFADFVNLLIKKHRIDMIFPMALAYCDLYRQANGIRVVHVTSAVPLGTEESDRIRRMIEHHIGKGMKMEYSESVNPDLIGGFTVSVDNELLDASVANELEQMRHSLVSR